MRVAHDLARVRAVSIFRQGRKLDFELCKDFEKKKVRHSGDHQGRPSVPPNTFTER